jgi:fibronectin type 3 domain-containing protein
MRRWIGVLSCLILGWAVLLHAQTQHNIIITHGMYVQGTDVATGINVYRSATTGGPYTKLTATPLSLTASYTDTTCPAVTTCFYVETAVDATGFESVNSQESSAVMPGSPLAVPGVVATPH